MFPHTETILAFPFTDPAEQLLLTGLDDSCFREAVKLVWSVQQDIVCQWFHHRQDFIFVIIACLFLYRASRRSLSNRTGYIYLQSVFQGSS